MNDEKNSMLYWFPKIADSGITYPKTEIVRVKFGHDYWQYIEKPLPTNIIEELKAGARRVGYPLFMRTDQLSGKHSDAPDRTWLPYVKREEDLLFHISTLLEESACAGVLGKPVNAIVFREFLELAYSFKAFHGMPIARERRYFINNGNIVCHHPYWIEDAIRFWKGTKEPKDWKEKLAELNLETTEEIALLTKYAFKVAYVLESYWSVDFAKTQRNGWVLIDMAVGFDSWHPECKFKLEEKG